jgi:hypothetical protein
MDAVRPNCRPSHALRSRTARPLLLVQLPPSIPRSRGSHSGLATEIFQPSSQAWVRERQLCCQPAAPVRLATQRNVGTLPCLDPAKYFPTQIACLGCRGGHLHLKLCHTTYARYGTDQMRKQACRIGCSDSSIFDSTTINRMMALMNHDRSNEVQTVFIFHKLLHEFPYLDFYSLCGNINPVKVTSPPAEHLSFF